MANSSTNRSLSLSFYGLIPLFFWAVLFQNSSQLVNGQTQDSPIPIPGLGLLDNATLFFQGFSKRFDSTKNITLEPGKLLNRIRERIHARMEGFAERWLNVKMRLGNRTISMIDKITSRLDRQKAKSGNESGREPFTMLRSFLDSLRNTVQNLMQNLRDSVSKQPIKWDKVPSLATSSGVSSELEHEEPSAKAISDLNAALKKLDKETRKKFNDI